MFLWEHLNHRYKFPFYGYLSDVIVYNRALDVTEINELYENNVANLVVCLAGQSNMIGRSPIEASVDDNYVLHDNRVIAFNTDANILQTAPYTINALDTVSATNPLPHPDAVLASNGPWKAFCDDLITYGNLPYRVKILLLPCAKGGSGFSNPNPNPGEWEAPNGVYYNICKQAMVATLDPNQYETNRMNKLIAFMWFQGETDMMKGNLDYTADFGNMIDGYAFALGTYFYDIPFLLYSQVITSVPPTPEIVMHQFINKCLSDLVETRPETYALVRTDDLKMLADKIHLDAPSIRIVGHRYYDALAKLLSLHSKKVVDQERLVVDEQGNKLTVLGKTDFINGATFPMYKPNFTDLTLDKFFVYTVEYDAPGPLDLLTITFKYMRIGNLVIASMLDVPDFTAVTTDYINIVGADPLVRPSVTHSCPYSYRYVDEATTSFLQGVLVFRNDGTIQLSPTFNSGDDDDDKFQAGKLYDLRNISTCFFAD